jgi:hemolysin III
MPETTGRGSSRDWTYDTGEIVADGVVHGLGLLFAVVGCIALLGFQLQDGGAARIGAHAVYCASLLVTLTASAAYNMWPVGPLKWALRRVDHAMIFGLIAGTYTPFLVHAGRGETTVLLVVIWLVSVSGMVLKALAIEGHEWLSTGLYIALGWSGVLVIGSIVGTMPAASLALLLAGGLLYSGGVAFHHWRSLRFQNAIWHGFVLAGAVAHFTAVLIAVRQA